MLYGIRSNRLVRYAVIGFVGVLIFLMPVQSGYAQEALRLPPPGSMLFPTWHFEPSQIIGLKIDRKNPFRFYFIIDKGQNKPDSRDKNNEYQRLIEYFLASLTIANEDMWVNLSPYRADKIVADNFAQTKMGSDLLAQDYILKQFTASLMSPEYATGKELWRRIYSEAKDNYKNVNVPADIFSRVWIVADTADVYQNADTAYLVKSHFKVMLDEDYLAAQKQNGHFDAQHARLAEAVRRVVLPVIEQEVNDGKNFARLRQAYKAMILATWFKKTLKESLLGEIYVDKNKVAGIKNNDSRVKEKIYEQYLQAYKTGVVNYIKKEVNSLTHRVLRRKYFSGGLAPVRDIHVVMSDGGVVAQESSNADVVTVDLVDASIPVSHVLSDDPLWRRLGIEASYASIMEPFLSARLKKVILSQNSFSASLSYLLADKLATAHESRESVQALIDKVFTASPEIVRLAQDDLSAILERDPAVREAVTPFLNFKGFQALEAYRVAHWFWQHNKVDTANWFQSRISEAFGVDIHPAANIGRGVVLDHGTGIVIGETAVVGDNVYFLHGVTLGSNGKDTGDRHPKVGNNVLLGANSNVLGNIRVGDGAKVGANATVVKEVIPGATIVGPQAKELNPKPPAAAVKAVPRSVVEEVEDAITGLEAQGLQGGYEGVSTHSGVGGVDISLKYALTRNNALQSPEIVLVRPAYGGTEGIVGKYRDYGYKVRIVSDLATLDSELNTNTAAVIFESPANPSLPIIDIERVIKTAHAKAPHALTIFDGSFATPLGQQPLAWGVDIVVQVVTKGVSGDGNVFGSVAVAKKEIAQKLRQLRTEPINEADAIKLKRGLAKFKERFARQQENARKYVDYLKRQPMVEFVRYPGDSEHPQIDIAQKQMDNPGHMIYFDLKTAERAKAFMSLLRYFRTFEHAVSLGDVRNLMQMPGYGALSNLTDEQLKEGGVTRGGIRWSVGIEDAQDVLRELDAIFKILQLYDNQLDEIPYGDLDNIFMQPSMDLTGKAIYFLRKFPVVEREGKEYRVEPKIVVGIGTLATRRARELATLLNEATLITKYNPHTLLIHHTGVWGLLSGDHHSLVASSGLSNAFRASDPDDLKGKFGYAGEVARSQSLPKGSYEGYGRFGTPGSATVQILLALAEAGAQSAFSFEHQGVSVPSFESAVDLLLDVWAIDAPKKTNGASKRIVVVTQDNSPLKRLVEKYRGDNRQILDFSQNGAGVKIVVVNAYDEKTFQSSLTADTDFVLVDEQIFDVDAISYIKNRTGNAKVAWVNSQGIKQGVHPLSAGADITILNITDNGKSAGAALVVPQADVEPLLTRRNYSSIVNRNSEEILVHLFPYLLLNGQPHSPDAVQAPVDDDLGGISLDSRRLDLRVKVDNQGAPLPAQLQSPQLLAIPGFLPVIRAITPMRLQQ